MGEMQDLFDSICDECEFADMCEELPDVCGHSDFGGGDEEEDWR